MTNISNGSLVLAVALSMVVVPLTSFLKRDKWPQAVNFLIALLASLLAGVLTTFATNKIHSLHDFIVLSSVTLASATAVFHTYFSGSSFDTYLSKFGTVATDAGAAAQAVQVVAQAQGSSVVTGYAQQVEAAAKALDSASQQVNTTVPAPVVTDPNSVTPTQ